MPDHPPSRLSPTDHIREALSILHKGRLLLIDSIIKVLDPSKLEFSVYHDRFYASSKLHALLDHIYSDDRGQAQFTSWMKPHAIEFISHTIYREMDNVKAALYATIDTIHSQSLVTWDLNSIITNIINERAPVLGLVLSSAAQTDCAKEKNKVKSCSTVCTLFLCPSICSQHNCFIERHAMLLLHSLLSNAPITASSSPHHSHFFCGQMVPLNRSLKHCTNVAGAYHSHLSRLSSINSHCIVLR